MKLYIENNGIKAEIKEIDNVGCGDVLIMMSDRPMLSNQVDDMEKELTEKIGKKCVILQPHITKILGV